MATQEEVAARGLPAEGVVEVFRHRDQLTAAAVPVVPVRGREKAHRRQVSPGTESVSVPAG